MFVNQWKHTRTILVLIDCVKVRVQLVRATYQNAIYTMIYSPIEVLRTSFNDKYYSPAMFNDPNWIENQLIYLIRSYNITLQFFFFLCVTVRNNTHAWAA